MVKIVAINKDNAYPGMWEVLSEKNGEYRAQNIQTKQIVNIYKVHCSETLETKKQASSIQIERANKIGGK